MNNQDQQMDEIFALCSIYNHNEFSYIKEDIIQCYYNVFPISDNLLELKNLHKNSEFSKCFIKYLPPIRMHLQLPNDYPYKSSPNFCIIASWLSPWQVSYICQKLDEIWLSNKGQEVLFLWFEFLRNDLLNFLQIKDTLDISLMYMMHHNLTDYFKLNLMFPSDTRAISSILILNPAKFFVNYNNYQHKFTFENCYYTCIICFEEYCGKQCIKLINCTHVYCKKCMQAYIATNINENMGNDIICPDLNCNFNVTINEVKELCPNLFLRYEDLLLRAALNSMEDIIFCPRISCQFPLIKNSDTTLATCIKCNYNFCCLCNKVYHGVIPCAISSEDMKNLIENYQKCNKHEQKLLEKKYGIKQIQVVEKYLTKKYLKKHAKPCPNCQTMIVKIDGCNKMRCTYCRAQFCWICGIRITTKNAYEHFLVNDNSCYKRLFEI